MALMFNTPERVLDVRGTITLMTGAVVTLSPDNIVSYDIRESSATSGFALGEAQSATYSLVIDNADHDYSSLELTGAHVVLEAGIYAEDSMQYVPFGDWYIAAPHLSEQSAIATLEGADALDAGFGSQFKDVAGNYPRTVGSLLSYVCGLAGVRLASETFLNSGVTISKMPTWPEDISLRGVVAYIAAVAGGFARITRDGMLEIVSYGTGAVVDTITPDTYISAETGDGASFKFNCLGVKYLNSDAYTRYTVREGVDTASNTLQVDSNPLYTEAIAQAVKNALTGFESYGIGIDWIGDPTLRLGDVINIETVSGEVYPITINQQSISYDGGMSAQTKSALATATGSSSGYVSSEPAINSAGMVNGGKLVAGSVVADKIAAGSITADKIAAGSVTAEKIAADAITAKKIAAGAIETDKLAANAVTADKIDAGAITADKIAAGAITADKIDTEMLEAEIIEAVNGVFDNVSIDGELYANFAKIIELAADSIIAGNIEADKLAAALAEIISLYAKVGEFDLATVENLLANALILKQGQAGSMQITNLAVTSANLLNATIGELVLKGSDGLYYRVYIGSDGVIHTEEVTVSDGEISAGQTAQGRHIVDTSANIKDLNTQTITGQSAIIDTIVTTALTAGKITASEALIASATIPTLYTTAITAIGQSLDLSASESIKLMVARKTATYYSTIEPNAEEAAPGDLWINPAEGRTYIAGGLTGRNEPEFDVSDGVHLMYQFGEDADEIVLHIDDNGNLVSPVGGVTIDENGVLTATNVWMPVIPSELHTSYIDIMQDQILINTGGHIRIGAGGTFDVEVGAAHFKTADYTLSILAEDGSEDTVLDFDTESKTLKVDEIRATNVRPYIPGVTEVTAADVGGIDGLANMLSQARYEHLIYTQTYDDTSSEPIIINGCDAIMVEIKSGELRTQIPPLRISNTRSNIWIEGIEWNCAGTDAITADSGEIIIKNCIATAQNGVVASRHARISWIGAEAGTLESAGTCAADAFSATDGADIKIYGMIPSGTLKQTAAGAITAIDTNIGSIVTAKPVEKTVTLTASIGNYSDKQYWESGLYQGYTNGRGRIYGCMKFTLPADVESITAATLTLAAENGVGTGGKVNVVVYGSPTEYKNRPSLGTKHISKASAVYGGTSCSLDATSAATALLNGTAKQLVLYVGDTAVISGKVYSKNYAKFSSAKLKITYQGRSST